MKSQLLVLILTLSLTSIYGSKIGPSFYIYGADDAPDTHAPFACSLKKGGRHECGCAIVSQQYVVTAAECVDKNVPGEFELMVGSNEINSGTHYLLEKIIVHENYDSPTNNIAVLKVKGNLQLSDRVKTIEISRVEVEEGRQMEIIGWGQLGLSYPNPTHLQLSSVKASTTKECKKSLPNVDDSHFCSYHKDAGCGRMDRPNMISKISYSYSWIKSKIEE